MAKNPTAHLRTASRADARAGDKIDRDNAKAVIEYMLARGAFSDHDLSRLNSSGEGAQDIVLTVESLPWNPAAPKRVVALELRVNVYHYNQTKRGRGAYIGAWMEHVETVRIPHWDYDGVDPLVAREPWERKEAIAVCDYRADCRLLAADQSRSIGYDVDDLEAAESLGWTRGEFGQWDTPLEMAA